MRRAPGGAVTRRRARQALDWSRMRIYIDEAGAFVVPSSVQSLFSLVLAGWFHPPPKTRSSQNFLPCVMVGSNQGGEVKGSRLNESQAAQLVDLASRHDVFVKFFAVDTATHDDGVVGGYKSRQADGVTANLTPEHHPNIAAQLQGLARRDPQNAQSAVLASLPDDRPSSEGHRGKHSLLCPADRDDREKCMDKSKKCGLPSKAATKR
jgi:hypothetical protein